MPGTIDRRELSLTLEETLTTISERTPLGRTIRRMHQHLEDGWQLDDAPAPENIERDFDDEVEDGVETAIAGWKERVMSAIEDALDDL